MGRSRKNKNKYSKKKWGKGGMDENTPTKSTTSASAFAVGAAEDTPELDKKYPINVREHDGSSDANLQQEYISALRRAQTLPVFQGVQQQKQERLDPIKKSSNKLFPPTAESPPPSPAKKQEPSIDERFQIPATPNPKPLPLFLPSIPSTSSDESLPGRTVRKKMIESLLDSDSDSSDFSESSISSNSGVSLLSNVGYFDKKPVQTYLPGEFDIFQNWID